MLNFRLVGILLTTWVSYAPAVEDCWALTKECRADLSCTKMLKCATDICAVPAKDLGFDRINMTCQLQCTCGVDDKLFTPTLLQYVACLKRTHNITDPLFIGFEGYPDPYICPAIKEARAWCAALHLPCSHGPCELTVNPPEEKGRNDFGGDSELVRVGLDAMEGTWYLTRGTSDIDDLPCTQMEVTRLNDTHWLGSEYQEAQVGRLGMRWSQVGYLLTPRAPGVFDLRMMLPNLSSMSACHAKNNVIGFSEDRWLIIEYCSVPYLWDIQAPTFGWWSYVIYSRTPEAPQDAVDRFNEILATHPITDPRTNKTVPIPVKYSSQRLCRYRRDAPALKNMTTCGALDIMGGRRSLRAGAHGHDLVVPGPMI